MSLASPKPDALETRTVSVEPLELEDLAFTTQLQAEALPHGFFARLGPRFLHAYLRAYVESPYAVALVARSDGGRLGYVLGALANADHQRWLVRQRGIRLAVLAAVALARRPTLARQFAVTRLYRYLRAVARRLRPERSGAAGPQTPTDHPAVLAHIAVTPESRGLGVGRSLERTFVALAREAGATKAYLVTRLATNGADGFYARAGWRPGHERRDVDGVPTIEYFLDL